MMKFTDRYSVTKPTHFIHKEKCQNFYEIAQRVNAAKIENNQENLLNEVQNLENIFTAVLQNSEDDWLRINRDILIQVDYWMRKIRSDYMLESRADRLFVPHPEHYMPSPYEYVILCQQSYCDAYHQMQLPPNWSFLFRQTINTGFSLCAFINHKKKHSVIVTRGSLAARALIRNPAENVKRSLNTVPLAELRELYTQFFGENSASDFLKEVLDIAYNFYSNCLSKYPNYDITFSGHSLGATVSECLAVNYRRHAVVFDSPGTQNIIKDQFSFSAELDFDSLPELVNAYYSAPNFFNTINPQFPRQKYLMYIPGHWSENERSKSIGQRLLDCILPMLPGGALLQFTTHAIQEAQQVFQQIIEFSVQQHSIDNHLLAMNPKTGLPWHSLEVSQWSTTTIANLNALIIAVISRYFGVRLEGQLLDLAGFEFIHQEVVNLTENNTETNNKNLVSLIFTQIFLQSILLAQFTQLGNAFVITNMLSILSSILYIYINPEKLLLDIEKSCHQALQDHELFRRLEDTKAYKINYWPRYGADAIWLSRLYEKIMDTDSNSKLYSHLLRKSDTLIFNFLSISTVINISVLLLPITHLNSLTTIGLFSWGALIFALLPLLCLKQIHVFTESQRHNLFCSPEGRVLSDVHTHYQVPINFFRA